MKPWAGRRTRRPAGAPETDLAAQLAAAEAELHALRQTVDVLNTGYRVLRAENAELQEENKALLTRMARRGPVPSERPGSFEQARRVLLDYEDQLQFCREQHGSNGRTGRPVTA